MNKKDWYDIALKNYGDSNYSKALFAINKFLKQRPRDRYGNLLLGLIYGELSNYKKSFRILKKLQPTKSDNKIYKKLYFGRIGKNYESIGRHSLALKNYDKMIQLIPDETVGYIYKGACLAALGEYPLAIQEHLKATKKEGNPEEAFYNLALIYRAEMKFEQAKIFCEKSLEIDPSDEQVKHCLKDILETLKLKKNRM